MAQAAILKDLITALDLETAYQLEQEIKVSNSRISKAINRNSRITGDIILAITGRYPNVSRQWLETGSGDMFIPTPHAGYTGTEDNKPIPQKTYGHATFEEKDEEITAWLGVPGDLGTLFTPGQALLFRAMVEKIRDLEAKLNVRKS